MEIEPRILMANAVFNKLKAAVKGLTYQSESDEPFEVLQWKDASGTFDVNKLPGRKTLKPFKTVSLESFFADLVKDQPWHGPAEKKRVKQYRDLKTIVETELLKPQVIRRGLVEVEILILGRTGAGDWFALKTKAIET